MFNTTHCLLLCLSRAILLCGFSLTTALQVMTLSSVTLSCADALNQGSRKPDLGALEGEKYWG